MAAIDLISSCRYTRSSILHDLDLKTLRAVLSSLCSPKLNNNRGKSRGNSCGKGTLTFPKSYRSLVIVIAVTVLSTLDIGEAHWFSDSDINEGVNESADYWNVDGLSLEVC